MQGIGELSGQIDVGLARAADLFSDSVDKFGGLIDKLNPFSASNDERISGILSTMEAKIKPFAGMTSEQLSNAKGGQAYLSGQIQDLLFNKKQLQYNIDNELLDGEQLQRANLLLDGTNKALEALNPALQIAAQREAEKVKAAKDAEEKSASLNAYRLKHGTNDEKASALGYADSNAAFAAYSKLKKQLSTEGLTD